MKSILIYVPLLFLTAVSAQTPSKEIFFTDLVKEQNAKIIGTAFPSFTAMEGKTSVSNQTLSGKVVLVNFWFEACKPCMSEMSALNAVQQKFSNDNRFDFISFTFDDAAAVERVRAKHRIRFRVFQTSREECLRLNGKNGYPISFLLDREGKIKFILDALSGDAPPTDQNIIGQLTAAIEKEL